MLGELESIFDIKKLAFYEPGCNFRISVGLSQHSSAVSSLTVANWLFHYIIQNFNSSYFFLSPEISTTRRASFAPYDGRPGVGPCACTMVWVRVSL